MISKHTRCPSICYYVTPSRLTKSSLKHAFSSMLRFNIFVPIRMLTVNTQKKLNKNLIKT